MEIDESRTACKFTPGRPGTVVDKIVAHHWGVDGQSHDGVVDWFCNPTHGAQTSAHFVVSAGRVHCIVSPADTAWHAGNWSANTTSIGIELRPEATDADYKTAAELVRWLRAQYGDVPLRPHKDFTSTACPGRWDLAKLDKESRGGSTAVTTYYRPVPSFIPVSQDFGSNATKYMPDDHWLIRTFGRYQENGHTGRDYAAATGTDVIAVTDGTVLWADWATKLPGDESHAGYVSRWYMSKTFAGICLVIDHGDFLGVYAHLNETHLNIGDRVGGGQRIARSGNTGGSTGPHLHFECIGKPFNWSNGMYGRINPDLYLADVERLAIGYQGSTINVIETGDEIDMATIEELRAVVREEAKAAIIQELTYPRSKKGPGVGGKVSIQDEILYTASNVARLENKIDAVMVAVDPDAVKAAVRASLVESSPAAEIDYDAVGDAVLRALVKGATK